MALNFFNFTKSWRNKNDFPTYESNETKVRDDMQSLFDELKDGLNGLITNLFAGNIPFNATSAVPADNVQDAIEEVQSQIADIVIDQLPDNSVTSAKLADEAVTEDKIADGAVTADKLDDSALDGKADLVNGVLKGSQNAREIVSVDTPRTLALTDSGKLLIVESATKTVLTVPPNSSVAFPVGTEIEVYREGIGEVAFAFDGVSASVSEPDRDAQNRFIALKRWHSAKLKKDGTNSWLLEYMGADNGDSGTTDHSQLTNRDAANQHPISSINGLQTALDEKQATISDLGTIRSGASSGATAIQKSVQASKTDGMTQPVGIDSNGKLWTVPGGGGGGGGQYIAQYGSTTIEDISSAYSAGYDIILSLPVAGVVIDGRRYAGQQYSYAVADGEAAEFLLLASGRESLMMAPDRFAVIYVACDADGWSSSVYKQLVTSVNGDVGDVTVSGGGGGVYSFTVTTDSNDYVFLQSGVTVDSILAAYNSGKQIQCVLGNQTYTNPSVYTYSSSKFIYFSLLNAGRNVSPICETITISNVETTGNGHYTYSYLTDGRTYSPVIKTDDMTQEVGLDRNTGRLWTAPGSGSGVFTFSVSETNSVVYLQNGVTVADIYAAWVAGKQIRCKYSNTTYICQAMWGTSASNADFVFSRLYVSKSGHASVEFIFIQAQASEGNGYRSFAYLIDSLEYNPVAKTSAMTKEVGCDYSTGKLWTTP